MIVRPATEADIPALCAILNRLIALGGTTAIPAPLDARGFAAYFMEGPGAVSCLLAEDAGTVLGFQSLERLDRLPSDCVDIASFARPDDKVPGVGRALFGRTKELARTAGFRWINATIRADNGAGLGYYKAMGFRDHSVQKDVPLADGRPVDRISKRFDLGALAGRAARSARS